LDPPRIDSGFLTSEFDLYVIKEGILASKRFFSAPTWKEYNLTLSTPLPEDDGELIAYIKDFIIQAAHSSGTAAMSPRGAQWGATDPDLKVKKVDGLRVVDASIMASIQRRSLHDLKFSSLNP